MRYLFMCLVLVAGCGSIQQPPLDSTAETTTEETAVETGTETAVDVVQCDTLYVCGGQCTTLLDDSNNCGWCGHVCNGTCFNGGCYPPNASIPRD